MDIFGWLCSLLFGLCYIPQLYKTWETHKVNDVSVAMWSIQLAAYTCGILYSWYSSVTPLFVGYVYGWLCTLSWLVMWFTWRDTKIYIRRTR